MKTKISLSGEMETLLIPLYGRAESTRRGLCSDPYAIETVEKIEYDFNALKIPKKTRVLMALRSMIFDDLARDFLGNNPGATVQSLGSGLDARYARVQGYGVWVDLDFPEVAAQREELLPALSGHRNLASSVTDKAWLDQVPATGAKTLVICEGLTLYLQDEELRDHFKRITARFPDVCLAFDAYSLLTARRAGRIPGLKNTGATIRWGVDDPKSLEHGYGPIKHVNTLYMTDRRYTAALDPLYGLMFRAAAAFPAAREAHRVLVYTSTDQ